ncbi:MAG TPA: hypothetical protein VGD69_00260 [Herpetosiphonaceae bacterium]
MAYNQNRRIRPDTLQEDRDALIAVQNLRGYTPANTSYAPDQLQTAYAAMEQARAAEITAQNALDAARAASIRAEWNFHNAMLGVKDQVIAQYGADSDAVASLGLKRKSERKRPARRTTTTKVS